MALRQEWNQVLRSGNSKDRKGLPAYTTTIHVLVSAVVRLARVAKVPDKRVVYRGLGGMVLGEEWFARDARGTRGGVEFGFLSTTLERSVALEYSGVKKNRGIVLEIEIGAVDNGAELCFISQYPGVCAPHRTAVWLLFVNQTITEGHMASSDGLGFCAGESELLFGPLSYLEVVGLPRFEQFEEEQVVPANAGISPPRQVEPFRLPVSVYLTPALKIRALAHRHTNTSTHTSPPLHM
jgi:hypothetical protein